MAAGIPGPPNVYNAGLNFDYSVWAAGTRVDLVNVNWDNNYRDVVKFADKAALNAYIEGKVSAGITVENTVYLKPGEDIYLGIPYNRLNRFNYIRAHNPLMPIEGDIQKDFYYFILECEYINPNTTRLRVQLDVWQTYVYDATFGNCYVERGHIGVANTRRFENYGRDYLTVPEGVDIGGEYQTISRRSQTLIKNGFVASSDELDGDIIVVSTVDIETSGGTASAPVLNSARGSQVNGMPSGADFYVFTNMASFTAFMTALAPTPWVSQGIISATYMPSTSRYGPLGIGSADGEKVIQLFTVPRNVSMFPNWRYSSEIRDQLPQRYNKVWDKLFTYPYMVIEMTAWTGNPVILKPESWRDPHGNIQERASYMPPNQRISIHPRNYNNNENAPIDNLYDLTDAQVDLLPGGLQDQIRNRGDDTGEYLDVSINVSNFPSLPIVNNMAISYMASNNSQIAHQYNAADWTQQRALGMAQGSYDVQTGAMHTAMNASGIGVNADIAQTANQNSKLAGQALSTAANQLTAGIGNAFTPAGAVGSAVTGASNAAFGAINSGLEIQANNQNLNVRNTSAADSAINENKQAQLVRDTNKNLADWAARGDYGSQVQGINAKVQDARMIQPSTSGQFGGESHQVGTNKLEYSFRWKLIDNAAIRNICEIWLRYGYAVRAFITMPQSLMVMSKFTYWKVTETYLAGAAIPEGHKQVLRGIVEKGVTVWANPDEIGQIDFAINEPLPGVSY